jgi:Holliday junction DNA helicase RuvA
MIASLSGTIIHSGTDRLVVEVGGVGLAVTTAAATCAAVSVGEHVSLATTLVVREDSLTLFGFLEPSDRDVFEILQSVSGFGPRIALAALSATADQLRGIVAAAMRQPTKVSGIGKKGAQRLILELADKLGPPTNESAAGARASSHGLSHDIGRRKSEMRWLVLDGRTVRPKKP